MRSYGSQAKPHEMHSCSFLSSSIRTSSESHTGHFGDLGRMNPVKPEALSAPQFPHSRVDTHLVSYLIAFMNVFKQLKPKHKRSRLDVSTKGTAEHLISQSNVQRLLLTMCNDYSATCSNSCFST